MQVQLSITNQINTKTTSFKSAYPVYHWCKVNGKYKPVSDRKSVENCQRLLAGMLNKGYKVNLQKENRSFLSKAVVYISHFDSDYRYGHYVRSYYHNNGGLQYNKEGKVCGIEPRAYLLTGVDAIEFEEIFGKPIGMMANQENCSKIEIKKAINRAKSAYITKGLEYIKNKCKKFKDNENNIPLELHVIYQQKTPDDKLQIIKMEFFKTGDKENPLTQNNIVPA